MALEEVETTRAPLRGAIAAAALLAACASGHPLGAWFAPEVPAPEPTHYGCEPVGPGGGPCSAEPAPSVGEGGPRLMIADRIGLGRVAAADGSIFFALPNTGSGSSICAVSALGGPMPCFASVPYLVVELLPAGDCLLALLGHHPEGPALARIRRARGDVQYQRIGEEKQWVVSAAVDGAGGLCVILGRPGPGSRELALERVRLDGSSPPAVLAPFGHVTGDSVACDEKDAYFNGLDGLVRVPLGGGAAIALGTSALHIALGPTMVYVATVRGVERLPKGSTEIRLIAPVADAGFGWDAVPEIVALSDGVVWHERTFPNRRPADRAGRIRRCIGDACETLVESPGDLELVAADAGVVFWTARFDGRRGGATGLFAARGPKRLSVAEDAPP